MSPFHPTAPDSSRAGWTPRPWSGTSAGSRNGPARQKAYTGDPPLEVKRRLEVLLEKLSTWPAKTLRQVRAVEVLEHSGTPAARAVLEWVLREGAPEARLTREAETALRRMKLSD